MDKQNTLTVSLDRLWDELVNLHESWKQYQFLFMDSPERVRMLNTCARSFFGFLQPMLIRDVMLGISRLTDPLKTSGRNNLVLRILLSDPDVLLHAGLGDEISRRLTSIEVLAKGVRTHRNKYIAHLDHAIVISAAKDVLPGVRAQDISELIREMEEVYHLYYSRVRESHRFFERGSMGSAETLVALLEKSDRWQTVLALSPPTAK